MKNVRWGNHRTPSVEIVEMGVLIESTKKACKQALSITRSCDKLCLTSLCQTCQTRNPLLFVINNLSSQSYGGCPVVHLTTPISTLVRWLPHRTFNKLPSQTLVRSTTPISNTRTVAITYYCGCPLYVVNEILQVLQVSYLRS